MDKRATPIEPPGSGRSETDTSAGVPFTRKDLSMDERTRQRLIEMYHADENPGFCTTCESIDNPAGPDQQAGFCEDCGNRTVIGIEIMLLDGMLM